MASRKILVRVLIAAVIVALSLGILSAFEGTRPLISEKPTVTPLQGRYIDSFNYTLVLEFYENTTIKLEIEKVGFGWEEIATCEYNKSHYAQTLFWNVTPFSAAYVGKKPSYRFKWGNIVLDFEGDLEFPGPTIVPELIYEFIDATVTPPSGYYNTSFTYSVEFKSNKNQSIVLEVYNFSSGEWEVRGTQRYTDIGNPEVMSWSGISHFASNYTGYVSGRYRFSFMDYGERYESNIFRDPLLLPTPQPSENFGALIVAPEKGTISTPFNFSVDFSTSKPGNVPVTLQVSINETADDADWEDVATKQYENNIPGSQIPINFTVCIDENEVTKNLASAWVNNKVIFWRVKGLVNESITIPTTYNINLKWYNSSVSPEEGCWYDPFSFKVSLSAIENGTVALQVKLNGTDSDWQNRGKAYNYSRPDQKSFTWLKETICSDSFAGNTWYRFEFNCSNATYYSYSNKSGLDGPKLFIPLNISFTDDYVEDKEDVIFNNTFVGLFNETSNTFFNFSINVTANDTTAVDLILVDSDNNCYPEGDYKIYTEPPQQLRFNWTRKELPLAEIRNWSYTFSYNDPRTGTMRYNKTFEGPRMIAVFKNYTIVPYPIHFNRTHNVTVWMTGTIPMEIELEAFNLNQNKRIWEPVGTKDYEPPGEQLLNWSINTFDMPFDNLRLNWKWKENGE